MTQREGKSPIGRGGLPWEGECQALLPECLLHVGHQGAAPQCGIDALLGIIPGQPGTYLQAAAGCRITAPTGWSSPGNVNFWYVVPLMVSLDDTTLDGCDTMLKWKKTVLHDGFPLVTRNVILPSHPPGKKPCPRIH